MPPGRVIRSDLEPRGREHVTILARDGGGIRGLIPARVLESLEQRAGMPTCRLFDLIARTSTGDIIALAGPRRGDVLTSILVTSNDTAVANLYFFKGDLGGAHVPLAVPPEADRRGSRRQVALDGGVFADSSALDRSCRRAQAHNRQDDGEAAMALRPGP
jgi:hypothetical protein